jgi:hypothetical protein
MPQLIEFPFIPKSDPRHAVTGLIAACRGLTDDGQPLKQFRETLKLHNAWNRERSPAIFRFLRIAGGKQLEPSDVSRAVGAAEDDAAARQAIAERLWHVNPIMFKSVIDCMSERVYSREEIFSYVDSVAYRGIKLRKPEVDAWLNLGHGLGLIKPIGIAFGLDERGEQFVKAALDFDVEEFLEEDEPEPELQAAAGDDESEAVPAGDSPAAGAITVGRPALTVDMDSPIGRNRPVEIGRFVGADQFADDVLGETTQWIEAWWSSQTSRPDRSQLEDFGFDSEQWMEGGDELLYRIAVAAALVFRLNTDRAGIRAAFETLDGAGVLRDLYYGTAPDVLPATIDPNALMLASLVARRCAECPDLANDLEKHKTAAEAFSALDGALGRGLFKIELFWMMRALKTLGVLRFEDLDDYTALPLRMVRDTLFRLGFISSPYAHDQERLTRAASAARKAVGEASPADDVLTSFALAAGCAYDCPNAKKCDYACRERTG